jgi:hypothetical protein
VIKTIEGSDKGLGILLNVGGNPDALELRIDVCRDKFLLDASKQQRRIMCRLWRSSIVWMHCFKLRDEIRRPPL